MDNSLDRLEGKLILGCCPHAGNGLGIQRVACLNTERPHTLQPRASTSQSSVLKIIINMAEVTPVEHSKDLKKEEGVDQIEVAGTTDSSSEEVGPLRERMTTKTWLAIISLALTYMTAFQQGACTAAIVKSIDIALGLCTSSRAFWPSSQILTY